MSLRLPGSQTLPFRALGRPAAHTFSSLIGALNRSSPPHPCCCCRRRPAPPHRRPPRDATRPLLAPASPPLSDDGNSGAHAMMRLERRGCICHPFRLLPPHSVCERQRRPPRAGRPLIFFLLPASRLKQELATNGLKRSRRPTAKAAAYSDDEGGGAPARKKAAGGKKGLTADDLAAKYGATHYLLKADPAEASVDSVARNGDVPWTARARALWLRAPPTLVAILLPPCVTPTPRDRKRHAAAAKRIAPRAHARSLRRCRGCATWWPPATCRRCASANSCFSTTAAARRVV